MRYVTKHGFVFDFTGVGGFLRDIVVIALLFVTVFVGMITFMILDDGAVYGPHLDGFMHSPARAFFVSVFTAMFS